MRPTASAAGLAPATPEPWEGWLDGADRAYARLLRSRDFARAQAGLANVLFSELDRLGVQFPSSPPPPQEWPAGCSRREIVSRCGSSVLLRFAPIRTCRPAAAAPVLICFALVNRPYVLDLAPDRSLVRGLLAAGLEVYLIDWGYPGPDERHTGLEEYIERRLAGCVQHILGRHRLASLNLLGVCQGGTLSLCYAALHPRTVASLVTLVTPVDFHTRDNLVALWAKGIDADAVARLGNVPGPLLNAALLSLAPLRVRYGKYAGLLERPPTRSGHERFLRMERWIFDNPDQAGAAFAQFTRWLYQENRLLRGTLELAGKRVRLERIRGRVLNVYATRDHLVPPSSSVALRDCLLGAEYAELAVQAGHVGLYTGRSSDVVRERIAAWILAGSKAGLRERSSLNTRASTSRRSQTAPRARGARSTPRT
jgi:polyhydroxyalkanoate synthase subunit PhaC